MKIKIVSYNIHKGFSFANARFTLPLIRQALRKLDPDIILLQEIVGENKEHAAKIADWPTVSQAEFLAESHWDHVVYGKNATFDRRHHGNAILSKLPVVKWENLNISNNKWEQRGLLHTEINLGRQTALHIFNVHLDLTERGRNQQLKKVLARASDHVPAGSPFLIGGDFNDWRQQASKNFYEFLGVHESFRHLHGAYAKSFPSFKPLLSLDRLYCKHIEVLKAECLTDDPWPKLSDHLPLLLELQL